MSYIKSAILGVFFLLLFTSFAAAQTPPPVENTTSNEMISTESAQSDGVNYELPYPGMLPDNPLYFVKMARDRIVKILINDPFKKAEFNLLNAQKRMYAAKMLADKGKDELSRETIMKSNNYLHEALISVQIVRKENPKNTNVRPFLEQQKTVIRKHKEVLNEIKKTIDKEYLDDILREEKRLDQSFQAAENNLKSRP